jgi:hypothetical protein
LVKQRKEGKLFMLIQPFWGCIFLKKVGILLFYLFGEESIHEIVILK